jgi:dCMP deaminase
MHLEQIKGASKDEIGRFRKDNFKFSEDVTVPCWIEYFLNLAKEVSKRSKDGQTKVGAVLTDYNNHIISTGYNSFPRGLPDDIYPNMRDPDRIVEAKYRHIKHAEKSCILNATISPWSLKEGAICYVTGMPCYHCLTDLWGFNVNKVYFSSNLDQNPNSTVTAAESDMDSQIFIRLTGMEVFRCV